MICFSAREYWYFNLVLVMLEIVVVVYVFDQVHSWLQMSTRRYQTRPAHTLTCYLGHMQYSGAVILGTRINEVIEWKRR
jgi:hypothetical protein